MKHLFALAAPLVFLVLAACDFAGTVDVRIKCIGPPPIIDSLAGATYNGACPYRMWINDTLKTITPGVV